MDTENLGLLTCEQFRAIRDEMALASMLDRGNDAFHASEAALTEARALRRRMQAASKRDRALIEDDYNKAMARWAAAEAEMCDILNDQRYKDHAAGQHKKASGE